MFNPNAVLALGAFSQATHLAAQIALTGRCDEPAFNIVVEAIYCLNSPSTQALYPPDALHLGLHSIRQLLTPQAQNVSPTPWHYVWKLNAFVKKLQRQPMLLKQLQQRLQQTIQQRAFFQQDAQQSLNALSQLHGWLMQEITLSFQIKGKAEHLHQPLNIVRIRVLLLAAIRACVLWRQLGGTLWHLWWQRQQYRYQALQYLSTSHPLSY